MPIWSPATVLLIEEATLEQGKTMAWLSRQVGIREGKLRIALRRKNPISLEVHDKAMAALGLQAPEPPFNPDPLAMQNAAQPWTGPRCPHCNSTARPEVFTSIRMVDGQERRFSVTRLHCPNNRRPVRGVTMAKGFRPCPITQTEEAIQ